MKTQHPNILQYLKDILNILSQRISGVFKNTKNTYDIDFITCRVKIPNVYTHAHIPNVLKLALSESLSLRQGYVMERLKSSLRKFYGRYGDLIKHYEVSLSQSGTWPYTMTPSIDQTLHQFANLLPNWTLILILNSLPNFGGFHRILQR